jgi:alanine racemase
MATILPVSSGSPRPFSPAAQPTASAHTHSAAWVEISAPAFAHNIEQLRLIIGPDNMLAPVIKSNAYGHGMVEIAQLCEKNSNVNWLCVAKLSESLTLREQGIAKPILVLGIMDADPAMALGKNIEFACSDYETASLLSALAEKNGERVGLHIKIDTGLARFGVTPNGAISLIKQIRALPNITINGVWSHCAESHKADREFTLKQIEQFNSVLHALEAENIEIPLKHMGNSAATMAHDLAHCNFFRIGLGVYGYWPSESTQQITNLAWPTVTLKPVASLKTKIIAIKKVAAGASIGYDQTFVAPQDMTVALLPVGYDDGYSPFLSNKAQVKIGEQYAPVIGRVAMNITTIDISAIPDAQVGTQVTLLGPDAPINAHALAQLTQINNPRYITTSLKPSILRIILE